MSGVVTIIGSQVALIRVHEDGSRKVWLYDRGEVGGFLLPASSRREQLDIEWGFAPMWESSDLHAQARQIAKWGGGRAIIDEADVEAAREQAEAWSDFLSTAGSAEAEDRAERDREADEARADAELAE